MAAPASADAAFHSALFSVLFCRTDIATNIVTQGDVLDKQKLCCRRRRILVGAFSECPSDQKWVGRQTIRRNASAFWHPSVVPIRVSRFAIDNRTPQRDLYLSQDNSLLIDGVLIPAKHLVNGRSIAFDDNAEMSETIEYFCVELNNHEVIFAEGTAAESFRYTGGQIAWDNLAERIAARAMAIAA
jgi:hypothetical protein